MEETWPTPTRAVCSSSEVAKFSGRGKSVLQMTPPDIYSNTSRGHGPTPSPGPSGWAKRPEPALDQMALEAPGKIKRYCVFHWSLMAASSAFEIERSGFGTCR